MSRTIVSTSQLCLSRQQQEFLAKYRTASARQAYLDSYGEVESNFLDSTSSDKSSKPVTPDPPLPYDYEVEYLEVNVDSGLAYINTNIVPNGNAYELVASFEVLGFSADGFSFFFGCISATHDADIYAVRTPINGSFIQFGVGNLVSSNVPFSIGEKNSLYIYSDGNILFNGDSYTMTSVVKREASSSFKFFSYDANLRAYMRVSYFKISYNDNVLFEMIPVVVDGVGYMYDTVTKKLFGAQGGGSFVVGPRKA